MTDSTAIVDTILVHYPTVQAVYLFGSFGTDAEGAESDVDIALLLPPVEAKEAGSLVGTLLHSQLEDLLERDVDLINLRQVSTVLQKEVVAADRRIFDRDLRAAEEFEMLTLSYYQKLNEERKEIIEHALNGGRFHKV